MEEPDIDQKRRRDDPVREFADQIILIFAGLFCVGYGVFLIFNPDTFTPRIMIFRDVLEILGHDDKWFVILWGGFVLFIGMCVIAFPIYEWKRNA
jgi:hypothetical protein